MSEQQVPDPTQYSDNEIDLRELFGIVWAERWLVIGITAAAAIISVVMSLMMTEIYRAEVTLAPAEAETGASGLMGQLGGAAALLGVNVGGSSDSVSTALAILQSRQFINKFIKDNELLVPLFASSWDRKEQAPVVDADIYNTETGEWLLEGGEPTEQNAYRKFREIMSVTGPNPETGIITTVINWHNPLEAAEWGNELIQKLNAHVRDKSVSEANSAIAYLRRQLELTQLVDMQQVFYQLIESQTRIAMLANVREEYVLRVIDPALVPDRKSEPRRALICVLGTLVGGMLALMIVFFRRIFR